MWRFNIYLCGIVFGGLSGAGCTGCGSDKPLADAGAAIHIWPESPASSDQVGVYVEVDGVSSGRLDLEAFDGTLCAVGSDTVDAGVVDASAPRDGGVTVDAGASGGSDTCPAKLSLTVSKSPQTFVTVFEWASGATSALITATVYSNGTEQLSDFRRISKSSPPDAGVDAAPADAAAAADASPATDANTKDAP